MSRKLESAMDWSTNIIHRILADQEMIGATLHLFDEQKGVDVVLLTEDPSDALEAARALILVRTPLIATFTVECHAAKGHPDDPVLRDWWQRRMAGEKAPVKELPPDYRFELLIMTGEAKDGTMSQRFWRIDGQTPQRTFTRYDHELRLVSQEEELLPLFVAAHLPASSMDLDGLRRAAERYLAHSRSFVKLYSSEDKEEDKEGEQA